ncbi:MULTISPECIES: thiol reductant ABC exporter subunit CydC [Rhodopseudomonas]|uniref:ABC transporter n=2 Tax=Rhodopseudomonas TaxID=1073 RepID=A0A0D7F4B6_RHOPL|nr:MULTISPECIES: thiol reductant ABC exporter subunit CydC [Rhodopseudomonas]KIZ47655.1 ABC transporter [Rhodopseudomonas palustris]MDF3808855.1 thiol reductant ABC exporter subunit CydC [Rhodopseudomonas sp. BAL398]
MRELFRLFRLWRVARPWLLAALLISLVTTLANVMLMATAGWFVTAMAVAGLTGVPMNYFTPSSMIRAAAIVRTGGRWLDRVVSHEATFRLLAATRTALFQRLEAIAPGGIDELRSGDVAARLKLDVDRLELVFLRFASPLIVATATGAIVVAVVAWRGEAALAVAIAALFVGGGLCLPFLLARAARGAAARDTAIAGELGCRTIEHLDGLATLLVTGDDRRRIDQLDRLLVQRIDAERRTVSWNTFGQIGTAAASDIAIIVVLGAGAWEMAAGRMAGPELTLTLLLVWSAFEAFAPIPAAASGLAGTLSSLRRLFALWDRPPSVHDTQRPGPLPEAYDLVADGVSFSYPGRATPALDDVHFALPQGAERVLDGPSASGKSTLIDLLLRVHDPDAGEIRLGGVPIQDLSLADLRSRIALVPQQPHVFAATIADNLRAFAPGASDAEIWSALDSVELKQTVERMPQQLLTNVGHGGARLSGGEARRLAVARGLLRRDARILVLDEPTEGLDDAKARAMLRTIAQTRQRRSLLLVSHRMRAHRPWR